ncbi:MAG: hypothetical protein JSR30_00210 [Proteobacteria bacterium]|nr:hypothetical protein [Pseudomonadota bacterium]
MQMLETVGNKVERLERELSAALRENETLKAKLDEWIHRNASYAEVNAIETRNLCAENSRLRQALELTRAAYIPNGHHKPHDCFSTGPLTGNAIEDLIVCPGCRAERAYEALSVAPQPGKGPSDAEGKP